MPMSNKINSNVHLLHRNVPQKHFIYCYLKINLNAFVISSSVECLMNRKHFSGNHAGLLTAPKIRALYTWHFSTFNQHVLLSTTIYCEMKTLSIHVACKWYISPNYSAIKHSVLNSENFFLECVHLDLPCNFCRTAEKVSFHPEICWIWSVFAPP